MITATILGVPATATAQQKGVFVVAGKPRFFTKKRVKDAQATLVQALKPHAPAEPHDGPVALEVEFVFPYTKAHRSSILFRIGVGLGLVQHDRRPDLDNLAKAVLDAANGILWADDAQIVEMRLVKAYAEQPGVRLIVSAA